jgi:hypothetical protein
VTDVHDPGQAAQARQLLVGRAAERTAIETLLRDAERGTAGALLFRGPSGSVSRRSNASEPGPRRSGSISITVRIFASRYAGDCTIAPYKPIDRSAPSTNASSAPITSLRATPTSIAKWLRVPAGTHTY